MTKDSFPKTGRLSGGLPALHQLSNPRILTGDMDEKEIVRERISRERDMSKVTVHPARPAPNPFDPRFRKRVVVYCRVSTDGIGQTTSFETQKKYYLQYVRNRKEWKLVGLYSDEGITATSTKKRIGLLTMLEDAKTGKFDIIVVKSLSRLSRNLMDCMDIIYKLRKLPNPVGILFETENMFTLDKNVDFTLQVLSLVAQEESHKKSEAIIAAYKACCSQGIYRKPDLLGYDSIGVNEIAINVEEAQTVQLMFMMYLSGIDCAAIAEALTMLGRKTHTHKLKNGIVREGQVKWTAESVKNYMRNERRCGDVFAPKTHTPHYLDHNSIKIKPGEKVQYFAVDQHPAIVSPEDYSLTQRIMTANKGGWKYGLPSISVQSEGAVKGFVSVIPNWMGFTVEDYNRASLRAYGVEEGTLEELEKRIRARAEKSQLINSVKAPQDDDSFQHQFSIDSDDYEAFPEENAAQEPETELSDGESFRKLTDQMREAKAENGKETDLWFSNADIAGSEVVRPQLFSLRGKACITLDKSGIRFNKMCYNKLETKLGKSIEHVSLTYNAVERVLIVHPEHDENERTLAWRKMDKETVQMRRCPAKGIEEAVYSNMDWNEEYKYLLVGSIVRDERCTGEPAIVFCLDKHMIIAPIHRRDADRGTQLDETNKARLKGKTAKKTIRDGYEIEDGYSFDDFTDEAERLRDVHTAKSHAIYYDDFRKKLSATLNVEAMGDKKYSPDFIRSLLQHDMMPVEGWSYLDGMAIIRKRSLRIYPSEWADTFGQRAANQNRWVFTRLSKLKAARRVESIPYGWTVGLDLPSRETVDMTIRELSKAAS